MKSTQPDARRIAAQAEFQRAAATIDALFEAKAGLESALAAVAAAATGPDPLRAALDLGELEEHVGQAAEAVMAAAIAAAEFIPRKDVATHLDSRPSLVFARPTAASGDAWGAPPVPAPVESTATAL